MCGLPTEKEVGEQSRFSGEQDLALAYYLVPGMETISRVPGPAGFVSITRAYCTNRHPGISSLTQEKLRIAII